MEISLPNFFSVNQPINEKTYYRMGGIARYFAEPNSIYEVQEALSWCRTHSFPCSVLGSGSNSVYADGEFLGLVISLEKLSAWHWESDTILFAEAGVTNTEISEICMAANRGGASWMYRMPGQLGASIRMNARCYGGEISQVIIQVITIDTEGTLKTYAAGQLFKGYKSTLLMNKPEIVVGARLLLPHEVSAEKLIKHMHECEADRHKKKHFHLPSCGSTFKNNYEVGKPSGQIFDQLGLKGTRVGNAIVSEFHANFVWNLGLASTTDMLTLSALMRDKAKKVLHAELDLEVQPVGVFSNELYHACGMNKLGPCYDSGDVKKWVGLLWYPTHSRVVDRIIEEQRSFPLKLFESPFIEYSQSAYSGCPSIGVEILQLLSLDSAKKNPNEPFLEWCTYSSETFDKDFSLKYTGLSEEVAKKFIDELWNFSVSEIFIADASNSKSYFEFEMTPKGEWLAIEFDGLRKRTKRNRKLNEKLWEGVRVNPLKTRFFNDNETRFVFGMSYSYNQLKKLMLKDQNYLAVQCALSLGYSKYFLAPYWKHIAHQKNKKGMLVMNKATPDFHQTENFWKLRIY